MPIDPNRIPTDPDFIFDWKGGVGGGGPNTRFNPPGAGVGGGSGATGAGGGGFGYSPSNGFDPFGDMRRRKMAMAFGGMQQPGGQFNPQAISALLAMLGGR